MTIIAIVYILFLVFLIIILILIILELWQDFAFGKVPFVPTKKRVINIALDNIETDSQPKSIYDLGAGDARFLISVARKFPKAKIIGFENSLAPYIIGKFKIFMYRSTARLYLKNFFKQDLSKADIIYCFLGPEQMKKLEDKFSKELKLGTKIIVSTFSIPNWEPYKEIYTNKRRKNWGKLMFYIKN